MKLQSWKSMFAVLLVLALVAVACGDDDAATDADSTDGTTADDGAGDGAADGDDDGTTDDASGDDGAGDDASGDDGAGDDAPRDEGGLPERIVSLSPTATEILYAIGAGDLVVAVDNFSNFPADAPMTDLSGFSPNVEAIAAFEPDLVVMNFNEDVQSGLDALGIDVLIQDAAVTISDTYTQIEQAGAATGKIAEAAELVSEMQNELDDLVADAPSGEGLTYFHELDNTLFSVTSATFVGEVYALFGLENVADPADADGSAFGYPQLSDEYLIDADPDLIFLADTICCGQNVDTVAERPGWDQLSAVQNGGVVELNDDIASRWGPRIVEFAEAIADALASVPAAA